METTYDAAILANGNFPKHAVPLNILQHTPHVIACDGAIQNYPQASSATATLFRQPTATCSFR